MDPFPSPLAAASAGYFRQLQDNIIKAFEDTDKNHKFIKTPWQKGSQDLLQGGGTIALLHGEVFEKMGVNFSEVSGTFPEAFRKEIPGAEASGGRFWASGVSLVCHPRNPHVPAVHFNVRRIETSRTWFGGGTDLTPCLPVEEDTAHFHQTLEDACKSYQPDAYPRFKKWCDEYFFLPHRNEARGVGGIFFDYLEDRPEETFAFVQAVGQAFLAAYLPLAEKHKDQPFTPGEKHTQLVKRGRYAEFNLLYDRGTRFGLQSGGNVDAILMSLPPEARWP
ncbi:MAG: oxygen-dependent coproporphyrinogen oxidase [Proteobacteria bacterium]|nr:oxygen-dependent coproporphyrinogen oxidase [Pseudomonadota bacterium]